MSETKTRHETPAVAPLDASPQPGAADPLQESLDELARRADSLVDGLSFEEPEEPAQEAQPQPVEATLEVAAEHVTHEVAPENEATPQPVDEPVEHAPEHVVHAEPAEPVTEALPATDSRQPGEQSDELSQQARREAMRETLDALNDLIEDSSPPLTSVEIQVEGDRGEDIDSHLDTMMAPVDETVEIEAEPAASEIQEDEKVETEVSETPEKNAPPVAPPDPTEETEVETAVASGADSAVESVTYTYTETPKRSTAIWWLLAIVVVIAALAASYWVLQSRSMTPSPTTSAEVPVPDPPVVFVKRPQNRIPADSAAPAEPVREVVSAPAAVAEPVTAKPVREPAPVVETAAAVTETVEPPADTAPKTELASNPAPVTGRAVESASAVVPETDVPASAEGGVESAIPAVIASRGKTTETDGSQPQAAGVVGISVAEIVTPPEPQAAEPIEATPPQDHLGSLTVEPVVVDPPAEAVAPEQTRPVVIDRIEPVFDRRTLRPGERQNVVLRVLVGDRGRVVRVVVDESGAGSDAEFAAMNAVLRWTYEPALEAGKPVRAWTTERFEFTRPD